MTGCLLPSQALTIPQMELVPALTMLARPGRKASDRESAHADHPHRVNAGFFHHTLPGGGDRQGVEDAVFHHW